MFKMSPGLYLFSVGLLYLVVGMFNIFVYRFCPSELLTIVYLVILALPLFIPVLSRYVGVNTFWEMLKK